MSPEKLIPAYCLGMKARQELARSSQATAIGITSQGVFLKLSSGWVIFLTDALEPGPLTLTLDTPLSPWVVQGELAQVTDSSIHFPSCGVRIAWPQATSWSAPPPEHAPLQPSPRLLLMRQVIEFVGREDLSQPGGKAPSTGAGRLPLLPRLCRDPGVSPSQPPEQMAAALQPWLGFGPGLTPWGDDLIMGLLLTLRRWGSLCASQLDWQPLFSSMILAAYRTTTLLSANLIECACQGEASAGLLQALDGLVTGDPPPQACANVFKGWGSTSGRAALRGILLALDPGQELIS